MKSSAYPKFIEWHDAQSLRYKNEMLEYHFPNEIKSYCESDVLLLKQGVLKFISLMMSLTDCDPFLIATTAASACNYIYRKTFMPEQSIAILPKGGYLVNNRQSAGCIVLAAIH